MNRKRWAGSAQELEVFAEFLRAQDEVEKQTRTAIGTRDEDGGSNGEVASRINAQHTMGFLVLSYLVLPPVAMLQFQALGETTSEAVLGPLGSRRAAEVGGGR